MVFLAFSNLVLTPGFYGQEGTSYCVDMDCQGALICQFDPYGCSCAAGFKGRGCSDGKCTFIDIVQVMFKMMVKGTVVVFLYTHLPV